MKWQDDYLYWIAIGILIGILIAQSMQTQRIIEEHNELVEEYNECKSWFIVEEEQSDYGDLSRIFEDLYNETLIK